MKRVWPALAGVLIVVLTVTLAGAAQKKILVDPAADFSRFETFAWMEHPKAAPDLARRQPGADEIVRRGVGDGLTSLGYRPAAMGSRDPATAADKSEAARQGSQEADLLLVYYVDAGAHLREYAGDYTDSETNAWLGESGFYSYKESVLTLDVVDASRNRLVWRGTATVTFSHAERLGEKIYKTVRKLARRVPGPGEDGRQTDE